MVPILLIAALQSSTVPAPGPAVEPPVLRDPRHVITFNDYPKAALRGEAAGIVSVIMHVSPEGEAISCKVTETSGHPLLDRKTCSLLESRARFDPAKDANGSAVAGDYRMAMAWGVGSRQPSTSMETGLKVLHVPSDYENPLKSTLVFNAEGAVDACEVTATSGSPAADRAICAYLAKNLHIDSPKAASSNAAPAAVRYATVSLSADPVTK